MAAFPPFLILLGAGAVAFAAVLYVRREPAVGGRFALLVLRTFALITVVLLLWDPQIPGGDLGRDGPGGGAWLLIDPDLSLTAPAAAGGSQWDQAVTEAVARASGGARLALALGEGGGIEGIDSAGLRSRNPAHPPADVSESIVRLGEAGADSVVVFSSLRWTSQTLEALGAEAPVPVRLEPFGEIVRNAGIAELALPATARGDGEVTGRVSVFGEGGAPGDSVQVEVRANGALLRTVGIPLPAPGVEASAALVLPPPPDTGLVRYTARAFLQGDAFTVDDLRAHWTSVGRGDGGIVLVSVEPNFEPRALLPVLEAVSGMPGEGYLGLADGRFMPLVGGPDPARPVEPEVVSARVSGAELLVVQGGGAASPDWLAAASAGHPRVLHLPRSTAGAVAAGLAGATVLTGEWSVLPNVPASPVSPFLAGVELGGLPPVSDLISVAAPPELGVTVALTARSLEGGEPLPVLVLLDRVAGRHAIALADGFSRWGSREGEPRRAYRSLWGGVAQWLLSGSRTGTPDVRPWEVLQPRGESLLWEVPGGDAEGAPTDSLEVSLTPVHDGGDGPWPTLPGDGPAGASGGVAEYPTLLTPDASGIAATPPPEPGIYRYEVSSPAAGQVIASGLVEVERWAPSLRLPPLDPGPDLLGRAMDGEAGAETSGRSLRTHPLPFLLLVLVLCSEWAGRRKLGLR